ncbi:hypothetical protein D9757_007532 [Collybiopsis confluens]|uniref:Hydrophobin n=1 Tax=Collybiopsis confluens TaxID=2823264 RepID=A0A8H5HKE6_9AGAR|nr:hypothetical protein D9757_007532 [Collybiopsis confluens]
MLSYQIPSRPKQKEKKWRISVSTLLSLIIMQFKAAFVTAAIASLAAASPAPRDTCSTGPVQCCNQYSTTSDPTIASLAGLLGIALPAINVAVGLLCSPLLRRWRWRWRMLYAARTTLLVVSSPSAVSLFSFKLRSRP